MREDDKDAPGTVPNDIAEFVFAECPIIALDRVFNVSINPPPDPPL
jgi:hypothetical protein